MTLYHYLKYLLTPEAWENQQDRKLFNWIKAIARRDRTESRSGNSGNPKKNYFLQEENGLPGVESHRPLAEETGVLPDKLTLFVQTKEV